MPRQKKLTPEQEKEIKLLQANNEMLEKTKEEAKLRGTESAVKRIEIAQKDVITQIAKIDKEAAKDFSENVSIQPKKETKTVKIKSQSKKEDKSVFEAIKEIEEKQSVSVKKTSNREEGDNFVETEEVLPKMNTNIFSKISSNIQYDVISLPSNGECYPSKTGRIPVGFLNASDENILTSPSLYQDGLVIDYLLKSKILDDEFNVDDMIAADADAVILFLRATSYGADFPISVRDPESGERFDTTVDLTNFKSKNFNLKGDKNGYFSFILPLSKDVIKFKYLTRKEEKALDLLSNIEKKEGKTTLIQNIKDKLETLLEDDEVLNDNEKKKINETLNKIDEWANKISSDNNPYISKVITNRMEMSIMAVNDNYDTDYVREYIHNMPVRDSFAFRRYAAENEPGIDWKITVQKPDSLGGGSFDTFLKWDDSIFFNISEG